MILTSGRFFKRKNSEFKSSQNFEVKSVRLPCKCQPLPQNSGEQKGSLLYGVNKIYHQNFSVCGYSWFMLSSCYSFTEGCHLERLCNQALCSRAPTSENTRAPTHMHVATLQAT